MAVAGLCSIDATGTIIVIDTNPWEQGIALGDTLFLLRFVGLDPWLSKLNMATGVLDGTNLVGAFNLLEVAEFFQWAEGVAISGTATNGLPTVVYYNVTTGTVEEVATDTPLLDSVTPLAP